MKIGYFRDLYAIVNDLPNIVVIGHEGSTEKLEFMSDTNGEDHFSSRIGVGGLLNSDKINLVAIGKFGDVIGFQFNIFSA